MESTPKDNEKDSEESRLTLRRLADEIQLKLNLASKEARDVWRKLEPKWHEFERKTEQATGKLVDELAHAGTELKEQMNKLLHRIKSE
jgi:hypothetical protein